MTRWLKVLIGGAIAVGLVVFGSPGGAQASTTKVIITVLTENGEPVANLPVQLISSLDSHQRLQELGHTDSRGQVKLSSFPNWSIYLGNEIGVCLSTTALEGTLAPGENTIDITTPNIHVIHYHVTSSNGLPVYGAQTDLMPRNFPMGYHCDNEINTRTDANGDSYLITFEGGTPLYPQFSGMVYYGVGSPNMQTYTIFESDIVDGNIDVVIEAIDEITLDAPSITSSSSKFDVTGQINADAQSSSFRAMSIKPMSVSSATATLFQRHKVKNKWSGWTKLKTATVTGSSVKFKKLKLAKGSYQLQVRRTDMSIGSEIQALKVR